MPTFVRQLPIPWRSASVGWVVTGLALLLGVPVFLRMPPWCDLTLYDVSAWNLLHGGVHYRDVFDTNLPGFVWALTAVRALFGWGMEALRLVDLLIVTGSMVLLDRLAARGGASRAARAWMAAGAAAFYPFTTEFVHCQRDVWMLLPAVAAVFVRVRTACRPTQPEELRPDLFWPGVLQGVLWGCSVWVKPHVVIPAAAVWFATAPKSKSLGGWRGLAADLGGNVLGGLLIGGVGIVYLVASGTWPYLIEVFTFWNSGYAKVMWSELPVRYQLQMHYFPPWSYLPVVALPVALLNLVDAWPTADDQPGWIGRNLPEWLWDRGTDANARFVRLAVSALYLGWTAQALFVQRQFHYVHVPEILLLFAVLAMHRWSGVFVMLVWLGITSVLIRMDAIPVEEPDSIAVPGQQLRWALQHPVANPEWLAHWPACWRFGLNKFEYRKRMTDLRRIQDFHGVNDLTQLGEAADWLAEQGVKDGELLCWHDSPHALYVMLGIRPSFRFQHVGQMLGIGQEQADQMHRELVAAWPKVRYIVSDLMRAGADYPTRVPNWTEPGPDLLPPGMDPELRQEFPYTVPAVFRTADGRGRYLVHIIEHPKP